MTSRNTSCPCGSDKKYKRCCGSNTNESPQLTAEQLFRQAIQLQQQGQTDNSIKTCQLALRQSPKHAMGHALLAQILVTSTKKKLAAEHFSTSIKLGLSDASIFFDYGNLLLHLNRADEAIQSFKSALEINPNLLEAHINLGNIYLKQELFNVAEQHHRKATELKPNYWKAHAQLAVSLANMIRYEEAMDEFDIAIKAAPTNVNLYIQQANLKEQNNNLDEAEQLLSQAQTISPQDPSAKLLDSKLKFRHKKYTQALQLLSEIQLNEDDKEFASNIANHQGKILDKLNRFDEALNSFDQANQLMTDYRSITFDNQESQRYFSRHKEYFTPEKYTALQKLTPDYAALDLSPIFIVGFPRSGTSLVEQIIGSHNEVAPAGELTFISQIQDKLAQRLGAPYPQCLDKINANNNNILEEMRLFYVNGVNQLTLPTSGKHWVTDKIPSNLHQLPLIHLLFPESKIINILRHPLDSALSCYFQLFPNTVLNWSFDLNNTINFFEQAWKYSSNSIKQLNLPVSTIRYETLADNPESKIRSLLSSLGISWSSACLEFHNNNRVVRTASYAQVNQPIYKSSYLRHHNYLPYLDKKLLELITPTAIAMGYSIN